MPTEIQNLLISTCLTLLAVSPAIAQDVFNGYSKEYRLFDTASAVKELAAAHPNALTERAEANLSQGNLDQAISSFKEYLVQNTDRRQKIVYTLDLADALQRKGNSYAAEAICDQVTNDLFAIPDGQSTIETYRLLNAVGSYYRNAGKLDKAKRCFDEILRLSAKWNHGHMKPKPGPTVAAEQELLWVYLAKKDFNKALPLVRQYPPKINVHRNGFDISIGTGGRGEGFATNLGKPVFTQRGEPVFGRSGKPVTSPGVLAYQRGVKYLNHHSLQDAERQFLKSKSTTSDASVRRASLVALAETYHRKGEDRKSLNALSEYLLSLNRTE